MDKSSCDSNGKKRPTKADDLIDVIFDDGPGDTTIRPCRFPLPREWPRPHLPKEESPGQERS
jgi:hypothetical protein